MPDPPGEGCKPYAYCVGSEDGWDLYWATPQQDDEGERWDYEDGVIDWPFGNKDYAHRKDFEALGFHYKE